MIIGITKSHIQKSICEMLNLPHIDSEYFKTYYMFIICHIVTIVEWKKLGPTEILTRIAGFRVQSANHYTIGPCIA